MSPSSVFPPHRHRPNMAGRTEPGPADGQRPAEIGQRAALVAHPDGELRKRAAEGLELIPLAPRTEMDFTAAWRLNRAHQAHQPRRDSRPRRARRRDGGARPVDGDVRRQTGATVRRWSRRGGSIFISAATRSRAGSTTRWTASSPRRSSRRSSVVRSG